MKNVQSQHYNPSIDNTFLGDSPKPEFNQERFTVKRNGEQITITDNSKNRSTTIYTLCYDEVKKVLTELFGVMPGQTETWDY